MIRNSKNKMDSPKYSYPNPLKGYKNKTSQNALMQIHKKYLKLLTFLFFLSIIIIEDERPQ